MHPGIVADVDDGGQLVAGARSRRRRRELTQAEQLLHAEQEAGAADAADQNGDLHIARQYRPAGSAARKSDETVL